MIGKLKIAVLGKPEINKDGEPLTTEFISLKGQALLIYLAVNGQSVSRSTLATLLWGEMPEERAKANLRLALTQMRQSIAAYLMVDRQNVAFNFELPHCLDVADFQAVATTPEKSGLEQLRAAIALYRADFLTDFTVPDATAFEEWVRMEQERLRQMASRALIFLAEDARQRGDFKEAIQTTRRLLQLEPWREETHQQLMWLLAYSGQRSAALAQFEVCRHLLAEELAVEPSPATLQLYEQIRREAPQLADQQALSLLSPSPNATNSASTLPVQLTPLVGREAELGELALLLNNPQCHLLTLIGAGGIGKTRLALAAAEAEQAHFRDGVTFVSLVGANPAGTDKAVDLLINNIANALRYDFSAQRPPRELLLNHLAAKEMLLLLDNFEQLQPASEFLIELLHTAPAIKLLVTSRIRLGVEAEWLFDVEGLAYPQADPLDAYGELEQEYPAARLFEQVAQRARADFSLAAESTNVNHICRTVAGFPLAIELAAHWVRSLSCREIILRLEGDGSAAPSTVLDILATTTAIVAERHQNMRVVLAYSWNLLGEEEQQIFRRLSLFQGGFELEAAEEVTGATLPLLASLVDTSWLRCDIDGRYRVHELLRQFGAEQLAIHAQEGFISQQKHCLYYAGFLSSRSAQLEEGSNRRALAELDREVENIRAAWQWLFAQAGVDRIDSYLEGLWLYYELKGWFQEAAIVVGQACTLGHASPLQKARWRRWSGEALYQMGQLAESRLHFEMAMKLLGRPLPKTSTGWYWALFSQMVRQALHRLLPLSMAAKSPEKRMALLEGSRTIGHFGQVTYFAEEKVPTLTASFYDLNLCEEAGASAEVGLGYALIALTLSNVPLRHLAAFYGRLARETTEQTDKSSTKAYLLEVLGLYKLGIGHWSEAMAALESSAHLLARLELRRWWEETRLLQALVAYHQGQFTQSAQWFTDALASARHRNEPVAQFWALLGHVECSLRLGGIHAGNVMFLLNEAKALPEKYIGRTELIRYHGVLALVLLNQGASHKAWQAVQQAARLIRQCSLWMFWSFEGYAAPAEVALALWENCASGEAAVVEAKILAQAVDDGCQALRNFARIYALGEPRAWLCQGRYHWLQGDSVQAYKCWQKSLSCAEELIMPYEEARAHDQIGRHLALDDPQRPIHLVRAAELFKRLQSDSPATDQRLALLD